MKILKLKFKNINSLVGENEIDFTTPFFTNDGLFAITGKTGSGKSSILDAITLALYGKTPRVDITGSENHVITKGQKDCYSEVSFEVSGKKWIASWKQERARTGTLKQVERAIIDDKNQIVADKLTIKRNQSNSEEKTVNEKIEEILGLSFSQFTKVILLAQGSFTAFLKADKNDKGQLLEQITGTEIYGEISKKVYERFDLENDKLTTISLELGAIQLLSESEVETLKTEISTLTESKKASEKEIDHIDKSIKWLEDIETITKQIQQAHIQLPILENTYNQHYIDYTQKELEFESAKLSLNNQEETFKKVRTLDTKLEEKSKLLTPLNETIKELNKVKTVAEGNANSLQNNLTISKNNFLKKQEWAIKHSNYEDLITSYPVIKLKHEQFETKNNQFTLQKTACTELEKELETLQKAVEKESINFSEINTTHSNRINELATLKSSLSEYLSGKSINQLQEEKAVLFRSKELLNQAKEQSISIDKTNSEVDVIKLQINRLKEQIPELNQQIIHTESQKLELENKISLLQENIQLAKTIQSLEQHRLSLKDEEPCPLCGSLEHPYINNNPILGNREQELEEFKLILTTTNNNLQSLQKKLTQFSTTKQNNEDQLVKLHNDLKEKKGSLSLTTSELKDMNIQIHELSLERIQSLLEEKIQNLTTISQLIHEATIKDAEIANIRDEIIPQLLHLKTESEHKKLEGESSLLNKKELLVEKKNAYIITKKEVESEKNELIQVFKKYNVIDLAALKSCLDSWLNNKTQIDTLQTELKEIENKISQVDIEIDSLNKTIHQKTDEKINLQKEIDLLKQERIFIFGNLEVENEENRLKKTLEIAESNKNRSNELKQNHFNAYTNLKAVLTEKKLALTEKQSLKLCESTQAELSSLLDQNRKKVNEISETIGGKNQLLSNNNANAERFSTILPNKQQQEKVVSKWKILNDQIGSKDGKKYRNFAQALTFEHLISLANKQLQKMSDRYALKRTGDTGNPFELSVMDSFQNNDERTAQNLSGGEHFMVSLALALGLANMVGKNIQIDSMFIDEGFATLDPETLDVALNTLSNLQTEGKMIGVISHLTELKERIANHIKVEQTGNGYSKIVIGD